MKGNSKRVDILHRIGIKASPSAVYAALSRTDGLAGWWTTHTSGESLPGGSIEFEFRSAQGERMGGMTMLVEELVPESTVRWRCTAGPEEWLGTDIVFNLSQEGEYTIVRFGHLNWREAVEFTAHCSMKWATFLLSLRELVETGKGRPAPDDLKIDNWN